MAENITIPKLGMTMKEATLVEWKFNEGDRVNEGDIVLIIETEKTNWEVEASASGYLHILIPADNTEPIGKVVGLIAETKEELAAIQKEAPETSSVEESKAPEDEATVNRTALKAATTGRLKASPIAKKMAEEKGIDLSTITGSGPNGRITKQDVEQALEAMKSAPSAAAVAPPGEVRDGKRIKEIIPLKGMRKAIADHMHQSLSVSAQLTSMGEMEATELKKFRQNLVAQEETIGTRITYTDIYVLAVAKTLKSTPMVNSSLIAGEIIIWEDINIGVAVALEGADVLGGGLIVPVVKNADKKSLVEISKEIKGTVQKARAGKLMPDDVSGGTFTITNMGGIGGGWGFGTPIINQPQSAILGTGGIVDRPVVKDGEVVVRAMMPISFTFDHRVIDGVPAGMFMSILGRYLSNPFLMLV